MKFDRLIRLWETGLTAYWINSQIPTTEQCTVANEKRSKTIGRQTKIKLEDLAGAFFILATGFAAGLLSFLLELLISRIQSRKKNLKLASQNISTIN